MTKKGDWISNHPGPGLQGFWPRRAIKYVAGPPKSTEYSSSQDLTLRGIVGIYLDEDLPMDHRSYPIVTTPEAYAAALEERSKFQVPYKRT